MVHWSVYVARGEETLEEFGGTDLEKLEKRAEEYINNLENKDGVWSFSEDTTDKYYDEDFDK